MKQFSQLAATDQIASGFRCLEYLLNSVRERVHFPEWAQEFQEARGMEIDFVRLCWIWEAVTNEPAIQANWSDRIVSLDEEWRSLPGCEALPQGTFLGIFFRGIESPVRYDENDHNLGSTPSISLSAPLEFRPGKARRLECKNVPAQLQLSPPTQSPIKTIADMMGLGEHDIEVTDDIISLTVTSLNQAYNRASRLLEPHRRSHGGRIYDHIAVLEDDDTESIVWIPLEVYRKEHEKRCQDLLLTGSQNPKAEDLFTLG